MLDIFWMILGIVFLSFIIMLFVEDRKKIKLEDEVRQKEFQEELNNFQRFLNEMNQEKENNSLLFSKIV